VPDLLTLLAAWGACSPKLDCPADLNNDETVNGLDRAQRDELEGLAELA